MEAAGPVYGPVCGMVWSRIWTSNEFIPHHTYAPPDHSSALPNQNRILYTLQNADIWHNMIQSCIFHLSVVSHTTHSYFSLVKSWVDRGIYLAAEKWVHPSLLKQGSAQGLEEGAGLSSKVLPRCNSDPHPFRENRVQSQIGIGGALPIYRKVPGKAKQQKNLKKSDIYNTMITGNFLFHLCCTRRPFMWQIGKKLAKTFIWSAMQCNGHAQHQAAMGRATRLSFLLAI